VTLYNRECKKSALYVFLAIFKKKFSDWIKKQFATCVHDVYI